METVSSMTYILKILSIQSCNHQLQPSFDFKLPPRLENIFMCYQLSFQARLHTRWFGSEALWTTADQVSLAINYIFNPFDIFWHLPTVFLFQDGKNYVSMWRVSSQYSAKWHIFLYIIIQASHFYWMWNEIDINNDKYFVTLVRKGWLCQRNIYIKSKN